MSKLGLASRKRILSLPLEEDTIAIAELKSKELGITRVEILRAAVLFSFADSEFWVELKKLCK